jgi:D-lactate dehydrogenase
MDLAGKTIGIVGTGNIGAHAVEIAKGFRMKVLAYDPFPREELIEQYKVEYVGLNDLLERSDIISLHVPLMPATAHLINQGNVGKIKKGAILINTARGGLVETSALLGALGDGTIAAAGLDVLEDESVALMDDSAFAKLDADSLQRKIIIAEKSLIKHPNVIITPHVAFDTNEAVRRIIDTALGNILAFASDSPMNVVGDKK